MMSVIAGPEGACYTASMRKRRGPDPLPRLAIAWSLAASGLVAGPEGRAWAQSFPPPSDSACAKKAAAPTCVGIIALAESHSEIRGMLQGADVEEHFDKEVCPQERPCLANVGKKKGTNLWDFPDPIPRASCSWMLDFSFKELGFRAMLVYDPKRGCDLSIKLRTSDGRVKDLEPLLEEGSKEELLNNQAVRDCETRCGEKKCLEVRSFGQVVHNLDYIRRTSGCGAVNKVYWYGHGVASGRPELAFMEGDNFSAETVPAFKDPKNAAAAARYVFAPNAVFKFYTCSPVDDKAQGEGRYGLLKRLARYLCLGPGATLKGLPVAYNVGAFVGEGAERGSLRYALLPWLDFDSYDKKFETYTVTNADGCDWGAVP